MRSCAILLTAALALASATAVAGDRVKPSAQQIPQSRQNLDCTSAIPISCTDVVLGDNTGMPNNVDYYSCTWWVESGGEVVYELLLPGPECYEITATLSDMTCDLDVFILGSCNENNCLAYGSTYATTMCMEPGTYYIVVDGYEGSECPFTLTVACVECGCPPPACCPMLYSCSGWDFDDGPGGVSSVACGGANTWVWGSPSGIPATACGGAPVTTVLATVLDGNYPADAGEAVKIGPYAIWDDCWCLDLCHYYDTESEFDGGNVKVSADGGTTWQLVTPSRGYDVYARSSTMCVTLEPVFSGHQYNTTFLRDCFDLSTYIGEDIWIGFFFGSDSSIEYPGWYIKWALIGGHNSPVDETSWGVIKTLYR